MNTIEQKIKHFIIAGEFSQAGRFLNEIGQDKLESILLDIGYDDECICAYSFVCFLLLKQESKDYHHLASIILIHAFPHLVGGYKTALYHIRRAIEMDPNDIDLEEMLIFFHNIPEKLVSREEAIKVATKVLEKKPESNPAKRILSEYKN